jgi:hypothetical protein
MNGHLTQQSCWREALQKIAERPSAISVRVLGSGTTAADTPMSGVLPLETEREIPRGGPTMFAVRSASPVRLLSTREKEVAGSRRKSEKLSGWPLAKFVVKSTTNAMVFPKVILCSNSPNPTVSLIVVRPGSVPLTSPVVAAVPRTPSVTKLVIVVLLLPAPSKSKRSKARNALVPDKAEVLIATFTGVALALGGYITPPIMKSQTRKAKGKMRAKLFVFTNFL